MQIMTAIFNTFFYAADQVQDLRVVIALYGERIIILANKASSNSHAKLVSRKSM
jgi:hypothetical protein